MATWDQQLISRIVRTGDIEGVQAEGITSDDFHTSEGRALFQHLLTYFSRPPTEGSVLGPEALRAQYPTFVLVDDGSMTTRALCHEVKRNRRKCELRERLANAAEINEVDPFRAFSEIQQYVHETRNRHAHSVEVLGSEVIMTPQNRPNYLVEELGLVQGGPPSMMAGLSFSAKTILANDVALGVASGTRAWGGYRCMPRPVRIIDYEQGRQQTLSRLRRMALARALSADRLHEMLEVVVLPPFFLDEAEAEFHLEPLCKEQGLVVIDSFRASCSRLDENSSEARRPLDMLHRVAAATGCCFLVIHHGNKTPGVSTANAVRGSTAIRDAVDNLYVTVSDGPGKTRVVHNKSRSARRLVEDIALTVEDVLLPGEPEAGLVVSRRDKTPNEEAPREKILRTIMSSGPCSKNAIYEAVRGSKSTVIKTVDELVDEGLVKKTTDGRFYKA